MISQLANLNWIGILIAFAAYFILGALWFTLFFSKPYKRSLGKENETLPNKPIFIVGPAVCSLIITITTAILIHSLNIQTMGAVLELSMLVGVGYLLANTVNIAINPNIPRPILYGIISGAYHLVGILMLSAILVAMQ